MTRRSRLDRLQDGVHTVLSTLTTAATGFTDPVVEKAGWAYGQQPYKELLQDNPKTILAYELTSGPTPGVREGAHFDRLLKPPDTYLVRFDPVVVGSRVWLRLNGFAHFYDVQGGDTAADIRDAFITSINLEHPDECVASINDPNELLLTANFLGGLWALELFGNVLGGDGVYSDNAVTVTTGREDSVLTLTVHSKGRTLREGARAILDRVVGELRTRRAINELSRYGIALGSRGPMINLTALAGPNWESRASIDVNLHTESYIVEPVDLVETVNINLNLFTDGATTSFSASVSAQSP